MKGRILCDFGGFNWGLGGIMANFAGENAYYSCAFCGIEIFGEEVGCVSSGRTCANGEFAPCPECGKENHIDRDVDNG